MNIFWSLVHIHQMTHYIYESMSKVQFYMFYKIINNGNNILNNGGLLLLSRMERNEKISNKNNRMFKIKICTFQIGKKKYVPNIAENNGSTIKWLKI